MYKYFCLLSPSPTPNSPPEPIAYKLCIICQPESCASAQGFKNAVAGADRAIIVTTPEVSAIRDADRIIGLLESHQTKQIDLLLNRMRLDLVKKGDMMSPSDVVDILGIPLIGVIPDDEQVVVLKQMKLMKLKWKIQ